jgi:hypothetical protein
VAVSDPNDLRSRAEARVKAREDFRIHLLVYVLVNALLWAIWFFNGANLASPWPIFPLLGWGIGLAVHWWTTYGRDETRREAEIEEEMRRMQGGR